MPDENESFEVGRGKPPLESRFQPGQSGNPNGRPRGSKNLASIIFDKLNEDVLFEGGTITRLEMIYRNRVDAAVANDRHAVLDVIKLMIESHSDLPDGLDPEVEHDTVSEAMWEHTERLAKASVAREKARAKAQKAAANKKARAERARKKRAAKRAEAKSGGEDKVADGEVSDAKVVGGRVASEPANVDQKKDDREETRKTVGTGVPNSDLAAGKSDADKRNNGKTATQRVVDDKSGEGDSDEGLPLSSIYDWIKSDVPP